MNYGEEKMYHAVAIEESLKDRKVLENFKILETKVDEDWHLHILEIPYPDEAISKIQPVMVADDNYYFHIYDEGKTLIVVFREKVFNIDPIDKSTWDEVTEYGTKDQGILADQLDFFPTKISDEPEWLGGRE